MQILPILVSLLLISLVQATKYTRMPKPKLFYIQSYNTKNVETFTLKSLEERRKLPMFPRTYKKFIISLDQYKVVTPFQIEQSTKKPLLRKLVIVQDKKHEKTERPKRSVRNYEDNSQELKKLETIIVSEEESRETVEENSKEASKEHNDSVENNVTKPTSNMGLEMSTKQYSVPDRLKIKDVFTQNVKPTEDYKKIKDASLLDTPGNDESDADGKEFMFVNLLKKDKITTEAAEEFVTTEEPEIRVKRSDNVIQEENLGTTVSGYKYTWRDTRLTNDLAFKNINS